MFLRFFCCGSKEAEKPEKNTSKKPETPKQVSFIDQEKFHPEEQRNVYELTENRIKSDSVYALQQAKVNFYKMDPLAQATVAHKLASVQKISELPDTNLARDVTKVKYEVPSTLQRNRANCTC